MTGIDQLIVPLGTLWFDPRVMLVDFRDGLPSHGRQGRWRKTPKKSNRFLGSLTEKHFLSSQNAQLWIAWKQILVEETFFLISEWSWQIPASGCRICQRGFQVPYSTTEDYLHEIFSSAGEIVNLQLFRKPTGESRGMPWQQEKSPMGVDVALFLCEGFGFSGKTWFLHFENGDLAKFEERDNSNTANCG